MNLDIDKTIKFRKNRIGEIWEKYEDKIQYVINLKGKYHTTAKGLTDEELFNVCKYIKFYVQKPNEYFREQTKFMNLARIITIVNNKPVERVLGQLKAKRTRLHDDEHEYEPRNRTNTSTSSEEVLTQPQQDLDFYDEEVEADYSFEQVPKEIVQNVPTKNQFRMTNKKIDMPLSFVQRLADNGGYIDSDNVINLNTNLNKIFNEIPSVDRSRRQYELMRQLPSIYTKDPNYFKPLSKHNLYDPSISKKHVGPRHSWMFDIIYFNDHNKNKRLAEKTKFLIGININTRYAVGRRLEDKTLYSLIKAFEEICKKVDIKYIIFDGEPGISSKEFLNWATERRIKVRITASKLHTQTAPIDRLCRTLRRYWMKYYIINDKNYKKFANEFPYKINQDELITQMLKYREIFSKGSTTSIGQVPRRYNLIGNEVEYVKDYREDGRYDEFEDLLEYYNNKPHNGIKRILDEARIYYPISTFKIERRGKLIVKDINQITPSDVEQNPGIEMIIVKYCNDYNKNVIEPKRKLGDSVRIYDVVEKREGSLQPRIKDVDPKVYKIDKIRGGYYHLKADDGSERNVSKYMFYQN